MPRKRMAFPYYGGKFSHLKWLLPIIDNVEHTTYVESFGGSAAVLLNKKPSDVEVYNDKFSDVVNFFRVLRNRHEELIPLLQLSVYSREEFAEACTSDSTDELEKARLFFVRACQARCGKATTAGPKEWVYSIGAEAKGMARAVSSWLSSVEYLPEIVSRLKTVQIENLDALDIIQRYDRIETLHYIDPPYVAETRKNSKVYAFEMGTEEHEKLLDTIINLSGKVILSGYKNELYSSKLTDWNENIQKEAICRGSKYSNKKQEIIWTNFDIKENIKENEFDEVIENEMVLAEEESDYNS